MAPVPVERLRATASSGTIGFLAIFPSLGARELLALLRRDLGYRVVRQRGSHRRLEAAGRPTLTFAFHDGAEIPPGLVRKILVRDAGLDEMMASELLGRRRRGR